MCGWKNNQGRKESDLVHSGAPFQPPGDILAFVEPSILQKFKYWSSYFLNIDINFKANGFQCFRYLNNVGDCLTWWYEKLFMVFFYHFIIPYSFYHVKISNYIYWNRTSQTFRFIFLSTFRSWGNYHQHHAFWSKLLNSIIMLLLLIYDTNMILLWAIKYF